MGFNSSSSSSSRISSSIPSISLNSAGFISQMNKPPEIKNKPNQPPLNITGEFTTAGVGISFSKFYGEFFLNVFQDYKVIVVNDKNPLLSRIFFDLNHCYKGVFGKFLNLLDFTAMSSKTLRHLNRAVFSLTMPDETMNNIVEDQKQAASKQYFRDEIVGWCGHLWDGLMVENPKLNLRQEVFEMLVSISIALGA